MTTRKTINRDDEFDVVIVGAGATGINAASVLVDSGYKVAVIAIGSGADSKCIAEFSKQQATFPVKHPYLKLFQSIEARNNYEYYPEKLSRVPEMGKASWIRSPLFGGLASGWGGNCFSFSDAELDKCGLPQEIKSFYPQVARMMGFHPNLETRGGRRKLFDNQLFHVDDLISMDAQHRSLLKQYVESERCEYCLEEVALASHRNKSAVKDYDFFDEDIWRPAFEIKKLEKKGVVFICNTYVLRINDFGYKLNRKVDVECKNYVSGVTFKLASQRVILCAGVLGTLGLLHRSTSNKSSSSQFMVGANPNFKLVCSWKDGSKKKQVGVDSQRRLAQLALYLPDLGLDTFCDNSWIATTYSLRAQFNQSSFFSKKIGWLMKNLLVLNVHYPQVKPNYLLRCNGDSIALKELSTPYNSRESVRKTLSQIGLKIFYESSLQTGSSIHYFGGLAQSPSVGWNVKNDSFEVDPRIYVGDSTNMRASPAKGLTFTAMANARRVASKLVENL